MGLVAVVLLAGCGTRVIERDRPVAFGDAGQGWQLVLPSGYASVDPAAPEFARLDDALGTPPTATALYPGPNPPSLLNTRRILLDRDADRPTFFVPEPERRRGRGIDRGYRPR